MRFALLMTLAVCACSDGEQRQPPDHSGALGQAHPMTLQGWTPRVPLTPAGGTAGSFMVDTGAMLTVRIAQADSGLAPLSFSTLGLQVRDFPVASLKLFSTPSPCQGTRPDGLLGGDFLAWFRLTLDYPALKISLAGGAGSDRIPPRASLPLVLVGGGEADLPGGAGAVTLADVWPVAQGVAVEQQQVEALVDTGASFTLLSPMIFDARADRPTACCQTLELAGRQERATLIRLRRVRLGAVEVSSLAAAVIHRQAFWDALSAAAGRKIHFIIGGSLLRRLRLELDYPGRRLRVLRTTTSFVADPKEFYYPGFTFCRAPGQNAMVVIDVYEKSDAATLGIKGGDLFTAVDGQAVGTRTVSAVLKQLRSGKLGEAASVTFAAAGDKKVKLENILPEYL